MSTPGWLSANTHNRLTGPVYFSAGLGANKREWVDAGTVDFQDAADQELWLQDQRLLDDKPTRPVNNHKRTRGTSHSCWQMRLCI
jgi:hypothetical protein